MPYSDAPAVLERLKACGVRVGIVSDIHYNYNQNLLGKLLIVLKRHEEQVAKLSAAEWHELHAQVQRTTEQLRSAFAPDSFSYAILQNQDRHIHLQGLRLAQQRADLQRGRIA